jgi:tetratricopeptide (TPR) repeat protein
MKINREPLPSLSDDILQRDHEFWKQYSKRLTGEIIDYNTPIKQITDWIEKTYLRRNFNGFTGDRKFIRDNDAQKAFSKLRSSIGGIYAWRLLQAPPQYRPKTQTEYEHVLREAEFTFRQSFAFCPYSPEAVFRYVNLLVQLGRIDDAILIAETCRKLDPYNPSAIGLLGNLEDMKKQRANMAAPQNQLQAMDAQVSANPTNFPAAIELAKVYLQMQQTGRVVQLLDSVLQHPAVPASDVIHAAQIYGQIGNWPRFEAALERLVKVSPESPEAWYDLAGFKANLRKDQEALPALAQALRLSAERRKKEPNARDLQAEAANDPRFATLRQTPEYQRMLQTK